ncbi:APC family permease [Saccharopolyspora mangrovi]|uniref:Amino acid permease n=1 Tax=Saccharopolyspora mangrovi TaxID=3082379 RepID=A0ABU6AH27_9PSEU|nr:amino acid permease [Saccharopolyspora sp. S2-29]MEB3370849.1 amino acid permease [Saccharopolyspora sp. S2-29]
MRPGSLGRAEGTALCVAAVLGPGVLALPAVATAAAGPASIVAWAGLLALSAPVAGSFAALGARLPDGGGAAAFAARAFGPRVAASVGWWFFFAVPFGVVAAALVGGHYVAEALGWGQAGALVVAGALLAAAFAANYVGLRFTGRVQLLLVAVLVALLASATLAAAPELDWAHFTPFLPHGWGGVAHAVSVLFFAFAGWEAISHLSGEFRAPRRDLPQVTTVAVVVVGVVYLALAVTSIGVLGARGGSTAVPLTLLLERGIGGAAGIVACAAAVLLCFGAVNTYLAGGARLGASLAREATLPAWLAPGGRPGEVPRRSVTALGVLSAAVLVAVALGACSLDTLMRATSACLAAVTCAGCLAAARLLSGARRYAAITASTSTAVVLAFCGPFLILPALLGAAALTYATATASHRRTGPSSGQQRTRTPTGAQP